MPLRLCIAIIDDDESVCRSLGRLLYVAGFDSVAFPSAEEFLADSGRTHFDCLLVDIQLGGMSGIELHERLIAEGRRVPVIFVTAHDEPATRAAAMANHCAGFFRKSDPGLEIIAGIRRAVSAAAPGSTS